MDSDIAFAPGAEDNPLARLVRELVSSNLEQKKARLDFLPLRAAVALVAPDRQLQVTLRFDHGYLTIHDGMLGVPDLTFCGDYELLTQISELPLSKFGRLPLPPLSRSRARLWSRTLVDIFEGELKIYGMWTHPRLLVRLLRLLSRRPDPQ